MEALIAKCKTRLDVSDLRAFWNLAQECLKTLGGLQIARCAPENSSKFPQYSLYRFEDRWLRPINEQLFLWNPEEFVANAEAFLNLLDVLATEHQPLDISRLEGQLPRVEIKRLNTLIHHNGVCKVLYTTIQSIGCILDLTGGANDARRNIGLRFEELFKAILNYLEVPSASFHIKVQVGTKAVRVKYTAQPDLIVGSSERVYSSQKHLDPRDLLVSLKTSSKDRMKLIFLDRYLLQKGLKRKTIPYVAIYHNDVQRQGRRISSTFVPEIFLVCAKFMSPLEGVYYIDPPAAISDKRFARLIHSFDRFLQHDMWQLFSRIRADSSTR